MASTDAATDPVDPPQTLQAETDCSLPCAGADSDGEPTHGACPSASYCNAHVVQTEYDCCNIRLTELRSYLWYDNVQHKAAAGSSDYTHKEADICLPPTCVTTGWYRTAQSYSFHGGCISNTDPCLHYNQYDSFKYIGEFDPTGLLYWTKYWNDLYSHYKTYQWSCHWKYEFQGAPGFKFFQHCWVTLH